MGLYGTIIIHSITTITIGRFESITFYLVTECHRCVTRAARAARSTDRDPDRRQVVVWGQCGLRREIPQQGERPRPHHDVHLNGFVWKSGRCKKKHFPSLGWYSHFFGKPKMSSNVCSWFFSKSWQASKHVKFVQADMGGQDLSFDDQYWSCGVRLLVTTCAGWPVVQCCAKPFSLRCFEIQWHLKRCGPDWTDQALRHFHDVSKGFPVVFHRYWAASAPEACSRTCCTRWLPTSSNIVLRPHWDFLWFRGIKRTRGFQCLLSLSISAVAANSFHSTKCVIFASPITYHVCFLSPKKNTWTLLVHDPRWWLSFGSPGLRMAKSQTPKKWWSW